MSDHDDVHVGQTGETAHDRLVVRVGAVAVEFVKVREDRLDVVERIGAVRVAGHLRNLPGREVGVHLFEHFARLRLELIDFARDRNGLVLLSVELELAEFFNLRFERLDVALEVQKHTLRHTSVLSLTRCGARSCPADRRGVRCFRFSVDREFRRRAQSCGPSSPRRARR